MRLHPEWGADAVLDEARRADQQGFDSVWVNDHLMDRAHHVPTGPLDAFTLMTAIGSVTSSVRLAWGMLNTSFRNPAVLAKMLSSLDQLTHGRVICSVGSGHVPEEYSAYDIPYIADHDERVLHTREVVQLLKELWSHPAPERVTFVGKYVRAHELPFNPAPFQKPHPPIWIGGDSEATVELAKECGDGWVMISSAKSDVLSRVRQAPNWPDRPMTLMTTVQLYVGGSHAEAVNQATLAFSASGGSKDGLDAFLSRAIVGTPDECMARILEMERWGLNYLRVLVDNEIHQEQIARQFLPLLADAPVPAV
jgi:alkanesulfonate monooxygenase SsuD/methylene tetrahydromethanopterin reductase-like flavin-dependent oxidoreductase (luciferase family)